MKLRSIALAGLLGTGLLMTSGCGTDDVTDLVGDLIKQNVVYTLNGTSGPVTFTVTGDTDTEVLSQEYAPHVLTGSSTYDVSYSGGPNVSFPDGSVYLYAATTCSTASGALSHEVNANKVNIVNLSETDIVPGVDTSIVVTQVNGTTHSITETVGKCSVAGVPSLNSVVLENDMNITVTSNGIVLTNYTVTGIDPDLIALGNTVKVDVVLFNDNTVTAVPMAGYDDLIAIAANQP